MAYKTYIGKGSVVIYDKFGSLFYSYTPPNDRPFLFNVNLNNFQVKGEVYRSRYKLEYMVKLPKVAVKMPKEITLYFTDGGNKAAINTHNGTMTIDRKYKSLPFFMLAFLYGHEFAHFLYKSINGVRSTETEFNCDRFAAILMLKRGYNPSQILAAMKFTLDNGDEQNERFTRMVSFLNNVKTKLVKI